MADENALLFAEEGRKRIQRAITAQAGRETHLACERGFVDTETGIGVSDTDILEVLEREWLDLQVILSTPAE
ncbi:MAG: hypothetical protein WC817_01060 [Patescibacteria group bacterium]